MIACVDVYYRDRLGTAALVLFADWLSSAPVKTFVQQSVCAADYEPGSFYKREMPCLLSVLQEATEYPQTILIDGFVWLSSDTVNPQPGLGAHLFVALGQKIPVVGLAKSPFNSFSGIEVLRGRSRRPLCVTAAGMDPVLAANHVESMHGDSRLPTMVKLADRLTRQAAAPGDPEAAACMGS